MRGQFTLFSILFVEALLFYIVLAKSYYEILGVSPLAELKEIKKAYYKLSLTLHPDKLRNPTEEDVNRFMEIVKAYETLSDPDKKRTYDLGGEESEQEKEQTKQYTNQPFSFHSFSPYYRFEATFKPHLLAKAPAIMLTLPIPLSSLYEGIRSQTLYFNRTSICPHCRGTGVSTPEHVHVCPYCNGTGLREYCTVISREIGYSYSTVCSVCGGSGHLPNSEFSCSHCGGSGIKIIEDFVEVNMNGGIRSDYEISFRGVVQFKKNNETQGNEQFLRRRGDVFVKLRVLPHVFYSVDGYNLHTNVSISVEESFLGFSALLRLPSNETFFYSRSLPSFDGMELAIQGKGIPIGSTGMSGGLFLHIQIRYPPAFSAMELNDLRAKLESREVIKEDGEWEETELFLRFKAMRRLQMIGESTGLAWSEADFLHSEASSPRFQCVPGFWF